MKLGYEIHFAKQLLSYLIPANITINAIGIINVKNNAIIDSPIPKKRCFLIA